MTIQEFINKYNGKYVEVAGSPNALNQCVDLANAYIREVLGLPIIEWTNAVDFPTKAGDKYDYILNTPTGVPQKGDLMIWKPSPGHIAIFIEGDANRFTSFDENFPIGSKSHIQEHTYQNVTGWLRAKNQEPMATITQKELDAIRTARDFNYNAWKDAVRVTETLQNENNSLVVQNENLTNENAKLATDLTTCLNTQNNPPTPIVPPSGDILTAGRLHDIIYKKWTSYPLGDTYWKKRLHELKAIFET